MSSRKNLLKRSATVSPRARRSPRKKGVSKHSKLTRTLLGVSLVAKEDADVVVRLYKTEFGRFPENPLEIMRFASQRRDLKTLTLEEASVVYRKHCAEQSPMLPSSLHDFYDGKAKSGKVTVTAKRHRRGSSMSIRKMLDEATSLTSKPSFAGRPRVSTIFSEEMLAAFARHATDSSFSYGDSETDSSDAKTDDEAKADSSTLPVASLSLATHKSKRKDQVKEEDFMPLADYIVGKCLPPEFDASHLEDLGELQKKQSAAELFKNGLLLFVRRLVGSPLLLLSSIKQQIRFCEAAKTQRELAALVEHWLKQYPKDFESSDEMQAHLIDIQTASISARPADWKRGRRVRVDPRSRGVLTPLSPRSKGIEAKALFFATKRDKWVAISERMKKESLPKTYLSASDRVLVKDKAAKEELAGKKESRLRRGMRSFRRKKTVISRATVEVRTICWRSALPDWYSYGDYLDAGSSDSDSSDSFLSGVKSDDDFSDIPVGFGGEHLNPSELLTVSGVSKSHSAFAARIKKKGRSKKSAAKKRRSRSIQKPKRHMRSCDLYVSADVSSVLSRMDRGKQKWDMRWPHLTLYFAHLFPKSTLAIELDPAHVAEAWTTLKHELFSRVEAREFEDRGWKGSSKKKTSPNIRAMIDMFDAESRWAQMILLSEPRLVERAEKLRSLLKLCAELLKLGNLDTACAFRFGIFEKHITNLPMEGLRPKWQSAVEELCGFDDSRHRKPKAILSERLAAGKPVIPLLAVHLDRLYRIEECWKPTDASGNVHSRWVKGMYEAVSQFMEAQRAATDLSLHRGLTERRDIQLLLIDEIKRDCHVGREKLIQMADFQRALARTQPFPVAPKSPRLQFKRSSTLPLLEAV